MRRLVSSVKPFAVIAATLLCALFACLLLASPVFESGEGYELYLGPSSSSRSVVTDCPALDKLLYVDAAGESVRYEGNRYKELKDRFHATLIFQEEAGGIVNYYLYSPYLGGGVLLEQGVVNLHIAISGERTAAGTPLIFGGF